MNRPEPDFSRFALFFDDPPIDHSTRGLGLSPINTRIADFLRPALTIYNKARLWPDQKLFVNPAAPSTEMLGRGPRAIVRRTGRIGAKAQSLAEAALIRVRRFPVPDRPEWVFAPVGADIGSFHRAIAIKKRLGSRLALYMVDDPLDAMGAAGTDARSIRLQGALTAILKQVEVVCAITDELAGLLERRHGIRASSLPLPYTRDGSVRRAQSKNQIIYVGSVNQIYRSELEYWTQLLQDIGFFQSGTLLITGDYEERPGITVRRFSSRSDLNQEIASSKACLLPISSRDSDLCFTSFPSKTLDYLAYSPLILASGPENSVVGRFFRQNAIPYFFAEGRVGKAEVADLLKGDVDHQADYHKVLNDVFSLDAFAERILVLTSAARA